jgi:hypothetical protein
MALSHESAVQMSESSQFLTRSLHPTTTWQTDTWHSSDATHVTLVCVHAPVTALQ